MFRPALVNVGAKINLFDEKHDTKCKKDDSLTENINKMGDFYKKTRSNTTEKPCRNLGRVSLDRMIPYVNFGRVSFGRIIPYLDLGRVSFVRMIPYRNLGRVSFDRMIPYRNLGRVSFVRVIPYVNLGRVLLNVFSDICRY